MYRKCVFNFILMIKNRTLESRRSEIVQVQWYGHPRIIFLYRDSIIFHKCKKVFSLERIFIRGKVSGKIRARARVCVCRFGRKLYIIKHSIVWQHFNRFSLFFFIFHFFDQQRHHRRPSNSSILLPLEYPSPRQLTLTGVGYCTDFSIYSSLFAG